MAESKRGRRKELVEEVKSLGAKTAPSWSELDVDVRDAAKRFVSSWVSSKSRPTFEDEMIQEWVCLLEKWALDKNMPLPIRKKANENAGRELVHVATGRQLVACDNSVAHWVCIQVLSNQIPTLMEVRRRLCGKAPSSDLIPVRMAFSKKFRESKECTYKGHLADQVGLHDLGWRLDHVWPVGLNKSGDGTNIHIKDLLRHFFLLLDPRNFLLVPKDIRGLGDLPEFETQARALVEQNGKPSWADKESFHRWVVKNGSKALRTVCNIT